MNSPFSPVFAKENPFFAAAVAPVALHAQDVDGTSASGGAAAGGEHVSYALVQSGPPVAEGDVETAATAIEVTVRWGAQVLLVKHLGPGKAFRLGESGDFVIPEDVSSAAAELVVRRADGPAVLVPHGARALVSGQGDATAYEVMGGREIRLTEQMRVTIEAFASRSDGSYGEPLSFEIAAVRAGKVTKVGFMTALAGSALGFIGASFLGHAAIVASLAMFMPKMGADDAEAIDRDQMMLMQKLLTASAERENEEQKNDGPTDAPQAGGGGGERHAGEEGKAGKTTPVNTSGRMALQGKDAEPKLSRAQELEYAQTQGLVGMIMASTANIDPNAPHSPWSQDPYQGSDDKSAMGDMFSQNIGDTAGNGGLGLNGTGEGGGGPGVGVGLDTSGGIGGGGRGKGFGLRPGEGGFGTCLGRCGNGQRGHTAKALSMRPDGQISTNGRLPPEVIQRIVRQNFGRMRLCYENGLRGNPGLQGRVSTRFVIGRDGAVSAANDAGSDLPDQKVVQCIVGSFMNFSFPQPEGGIATVVYPLTLSPGE
jgi:hypothetical protein